MPDNWAVIEITNQSSGDILCDHNYTLICTVQAIEGMNITPEVHWYHPDGSLVETKREQLIVGTAETDGTITTLTLTFSPYHVMMEECTLAKLRSPYPG